MSTKRSQKPSDEAGPAHKRARGSTEDEDETEEVVETKMEEETMNMSQQPDFHHAPTMSNEADVGVIESISLKNFMCHSRLDVPLKPSVNFIIGQNGSGKSAIMTGLVVGLGGKAAATSRGTSVKTFIKTGRQVAEVTVKLRNKGQDAYKPDEYGEKIVVERRLTADGTSQYKLRSSAGKIVSTKRDELTHILDTFNIQVDNPISVLNQDTSRNFLHSKSPYEKYKFFLKATQLEQMKTDYLSADNSKFLAEDILQQKKATLPVLKREVEEWEQKYKAIQSLDDLRAKVTRLKNEMAWAFVHERELEVEAALKELTSEEARTPKFQSKVESSRQAVEKLNTEYKGIQDQVTKLANQMKELEPKKTDAKKDLSDKKIVVRNKQMELRKCINGYNSTLHDKQQISERIEEIKSSAKEDLDQEKLAREVKISELQDKIKELEARKNVTRQDLDQFKGAVMKYREDLQQQRGEENDLRRRTEFVRKNLSQLEASRGNTMGKFGQWMPNLLQQIDTAHRRGRFHEKPRGPLGADITLRQPKWALAVECCLGGLMQAFCVHDHHDERELEKIFAACCPEGKKPTTITSPFQDRIYNVARHRPRARQYPTVLEVLRLDDPVVANCLIDQRGIEGVVLIEDTKLSREFMGSDQAKQLGCNEAFNIEGDQLYSVPTFRYYSANKDKANFLTADLEGDITAAKEEVARLNGELRTTSDNMKQIQNDIQRNQRQERDCQHRLDGLGRDIGQIGFELEELRNRDEVAPVDVTTLEEEVARYTEQLEELTKRKATLEGEMSAARDKLVAAEAEYNRVDGEIKSLTTGFDDIKDDLVTRENKLETAKNNKKHYDAKMKEHQKMIDQKRKAHTAKAKLLEEDIGKAEQICPQVRTERTAQYIDSEIQQIMKTIKTEEKNRGSKEEISKRYADTLSSFNNIKVEINQLAKFLQELSKSLTRRTERYTIISTLIGIRAKYCFSHILDVRDFSGRMSINHDQGTLDVRALDVVMKCRHKQYSRFRQMIALRAKYFFIMMLSNRNYSGKIQFDHVKESLSMSVQPNVANAKQTHDLKSLSGGERSFATVCFILALWDTMDSPFRCLDEFDVFMDMVNRRISMDMMMDVALKHRGHQFIFLTPQDMSFMRPQHGAYIFRMPNPERGQTTLPFRTAREEQEEADEQQAGPSNSRN